MSFTCALCPRTKKLNKSEFTTVGSDDVEEKINIAYEDIHGIPLSKTILEQQVHKECYSTYHRRYSRAIEHEKSSNEALNCLSTHRLPLADLSNSRFSSLIQATSINLWSKVQSQQ